MAETAQRCAAREGSVKTHYFRAVQALRDALAESLAMSTDSRDRSVERRLSLARARATLDAGDAALDGVALARLAAARRAAVARMDRVA